MIEGAVDLEDRLTLPEFANLEWRPSGTSTPSKLAMFSSADNRYSWMRTMQSRACKLPGPVGGSTRASLYRLGDLADWVREHGEAEVIFDSGWTLLRAARSFAEEQQIDPGSASRIAETVPLDRLRRFLVGVALLWAFARESTSLRGNVLEAVLREGDDLPGRLGALALRSGSGSDRLAGQLLSFVPTPSRAAPRAAARGCDARVRRGEPAIPHRLPL